MEEYDEVDRFIDIQINTELGKLIVNDIGPVTCQLFKRANEYEGVPFASAVLAKFGNAYYILTASHVIED